MTARDQAGSMPAYRIDAPFWENLGGFFRRGEMIGMLAIDDIRRQYTRSFLGLSWLVMKPLVLIGMYAVLFGMVFQSRTGPAQGTSDFLLILLTGLLPWLMFADAISSSANAVTANTGLVTKILFPIEVLPVAKVLGTMASSLVGMLVLSVILASVQHAGWPLLLLPFLIVTQLAFMIGVAWVLSAVNVAIRDVSQVLPLALMLGMFLTPVVYTKDMVPPALAAVFAVNPMTYFLEAYRTILLSGRPPALSLWVILLGVSSVTFLLGFGAFHRMRAIIRDLV